MANCKHGRIVGYCFKCNDESKSNETRIEQLEAQNKALRDALESLLLMCENANTGAWRNGVTDQSGRDEGDYWAGQFIDKARAALSAPAP